MRGSPAIAARGGWPEQSIQHNKDFDEVRPVQRTRVSRAFVQECYTARSRRTHAQRLPSMRSVALCTAFAWASLTAATAMADVTITNPDATPNDTPEADLNIQAKPTSQWTGVWNRGQSARRHRRPASVARQIRRDVRPHRDQRIPLQPARRPEHGRHLRRPDDGHGPGGYARRHSACRAVCSTSAR